MTLKVRNLIYAVAALLLVSLFIGSAEARGGNFVIGPSDDAIEKIQLSNPDNVVGNISICNGFVDFFVTNPSYDIVYQSSKTSFDSFNFTANENGTYVIHVVNRYQFEAVNVTLFYHINFIFTLSSTISVSAFSTQTINSGSITITRVQPYIHLDISPSAFPVAGRFWQINVFYQNSSSDDITYYSPLPNAIVEVTIKERNQTKVYKITSDELGHSEFQFLTDITNISFQAISGGNRSDIVALTQRAEHYVSADIVDSMLVTSALMSGVAVAIAGASVYFKKRMRTIVSLLLGTVLLLSFVQFATSLASKWFLLTPWGYPETIFSFLTWTILRYASAIGLLLFVILSLLALLPKLRRHELTVPIK